MTGEFFFQKFILHCKKYSLMHERKYFELWMIERSGKHIFAFANKQIDFKIRIFFNIRSNILRSILMLNYYFH